MRKYIREELQALDKNIEVVQKDLFCRDREIILAFFKEAKMMLKAKSVVEPIKNNVINLLNGVYTSIYLSKKGVSFE